MTKTKASTPPASKIRDERHLTEVARHVVIPAGIVSTGWGPVYSQIKKFGDEFDVWQEDAGRVVLGKRANGDYAATQGGVLLAFPRQVFKTFFVGRIIFALCTIFPNLTVIWTAHHMRTTDNTFMKLSQLAKRPTVAPYIDGRPREANGQQEIKFISGSRIIFGSRSQGFGRGLDEVDIAVFDEAQILSEKGPEDIVAAANQSRFPAGALIFYMGTPPRPTDPGELFTTRRNDALAFREGNHFGQPSIGEDDVYIECSADKNADPDDRKQWALGNPSYPLRTPARSMIRLRKNLPSVDSWMREGLGVWDEITSITPLIAPNSWTELVIPAEERPEGKLCVGVKFSVDGALAGLSVGVAPDDLDAPKHVDGLRVASTAEGVGWIVDWCVQRRERIKQIVIDGKGADQVLLDELEDADFLVRSRAKLRSSHPVLTPNLDEYCAAHELFLQRLNGGELTHCGGQTLTEQVGGSIRRKIGNKGGWGFQPINESGNCVLLDSAVLAFWSASTCTRSRRGGRMRING